MSSVASMEVQRPDTRPNEIDSEGLIEIANADQDSRSADIVFIHGLRGRSHTTWKHDGLTEAENFFWPAALGQDLPHCAIWTIGYPAGVTTLVGSPGMIIETRASNLAQKLANAGLGDRPLVFITHSMGGLIIKALLVKSQTQADQDMKRIARKTCGIVFCATPHRGSDFANAVSVLGTFFGGVQDHVKEMLAGKEQLDILHDEFVEWQRRTKVHVCSYAENIGLFRKSKWFRLVPLGKVVPRDSANPNIAGHTVRVVDEDHLTIVKPKNRSSDVYGGVLRFVAEVTAHATPEACRDELSNDKPIESASQKASHTRKGLDIEPDEGEQITLMNCVAPIKLIKIANGALQTLPGRTNVIPEFFISECLITQSQWNVVATYQERRERDLAPNPSRFYESEPSELPVDNVSWDDANEFCRRVSRLANRGSCFLPTEAQWQMACHEISSDNSDSPININNHYEKTLPVKSFQPNQFRLYDMNSNLLQWCRDQWHDSLSQLDRTSDYRIVKGCSWNSRPDDCTCNYRLKCHRSTTNASIGFRIVIEF